MTTPPAKPRRRGRPTAASADQREALLDAAIALFGEHGSAATSQIAIARKAGVTPALLNYYFGSRQSLLDAVIEERLMRLIGPGTAGIAQLDPNADPRQVLQQLVAGLIARIAAAPWLPPLWVHEVLSPGGQLREQLLERVVRQVAPKVRLLTARGQAAGLINPDLDPRLLLISLVGLSIFMLAAAPLWQQLPDSADIDADTLTRHVLALLKSGLEPSHDTPP